MRVIHLSADPPDNISPNSGGEYGDPGNYAFNSRNKILFGQWEVDDFNIMYLFPLPHVFTFLSFFLFGTGIWQMNLVPLFFSSLLWIALFFLSSRYFPRAQGLFFLFLLLNYPFGIYSRIADRIMPMTFFTILAVLFFLKAWDKPKYFLLSALFLCCSFLSKGKIIYFHLFVIPLSFLLILLQRKELFRIRLNLTRFSYFAAGALAGALPWYFFLYSPHRTLFSSMISNNAYMFPKNFPEALSNWFARPSFSFYPTNILLSFLLFGYFLILILLLFSPNFREKISPLEIVCVVWLIVGLFYNSIIGYRPIRHYIEFTIPLLILGSLLLSRLTSPLQLKIPWRKALILFVLTFLLAWIGVTAYTRELLLFSRMAYRLNNILLTTVLLALGLSLLLTLLILAFYSWKKIPLSRKWAVLLTVMVIGVYGIQNVRELALWVSQPTFNLKRISRDLGRAFPQGIFSGLLAPSIGLENRNRVHTSWADFINDNPHFLKQKKVTHLFLATFNREPDYYAANFPDEMKRAEFLVRYKIWRSWFLLYEIKEKPSPSRAGPFLEAEKMERDAGFPVFDPQASNRFSLYVEQKAKGIIGQESFWIPSTGRWKANIFIKLKEIKGEGPLLLLFLSKNGAVLSKKAVSLPATDRNEYFANYKSIPQELFFPSEGTYDLKIQCTGNAAFCFDRIEWNLKD